MFYDEFSDNVTCFIPFNWGRGYVDYYIVIYKNGIKYTY